MIHILLHQSFLKIYCLFSIQKTVKSLSLLYLLFRSWFICFLRWCIDKLGVFHANQTSMCLDPHLNWGWGWRRETGLSPPVKYFYWLFQVGASFVDHLCFLCLVFLMLSCLFIAALMLGHHRLASQMPFKWHFAKWHFTGWVGRFLWYFDPFFPHQLKKQQQKRQSLETSDKTFWIRACN